MITARQAMAAVAGIVVLVVSFGVIYPAMIDSVTPDIDKAGVGGSVNIHTEKAAQPFEEMRYQLKAGDRQVVALNIPNEKDTKLVGEVTVSGDSYLLIQIATDLDGNCAFGGCPTVKRVESDKAAGWFTPPDNNKLDYPVTPNSILYLKFDNSHSQTEQTVTANLSVSYTKVTKTPQ